MDEVYDINNVYVGYLSVVTFVDEWRGYHRYKKLKKSIISKTNGRYIDFETNLEYGTGIYYNDQAGKMVFQELTPAIEYFLERNIKIKKEMTKQELLDLFYPEKKGFFSINDLVVGDIVGIKDKDNKNITKPFKTCVFYKKGMNNAYSYIELETSRNFFTEDYDDISDGDLVVKSDSIIPLKKYFVDNNIFYDDYMKKEDILKKYNDNFDVSFEEYTKGINIDEDTLMQIEMCGKKSELLEVLKNISNPKVETKIISVKPLERVRRQVVGELYLEERL